MKRISKYQIRFLFNLCKVNKSLGKIKERISSSAVKNSSNYSSEPGLFKKACTILLCLQAKVLIQESRSIYFIRYKLFFLGSIRKNWSIISKSDESTHTILLIRCPNTLQNFALANDLIRGIIGTIISIFC